METEARGRPWWSGWKAWALGFALFTADGLLHFWYFYLDGAVRGGLGAVHTRMIEELTGAWGAGLLFPLVVWMTRRLRGPRARWLHLPAILVYSAAHTTWNWGARRAAFAAFGYGAYDYGRMGWRYLMELPSDVLSYGMLMVLVLLLDHYTAAREREVRMAELEAEVVRVRLRGLEAQLQPHFLFNALNTVSSVMYESVAQADWMLTRLADLLRRSLDAPEGGEVTLADELEALELYLDIVRARFGDRLTVRVDADPAAARAAVPHLVLQSLVENAVEHGDPGPGAAARVSVRTRRRKDDVLLTVEDDGPGLGIAPEAALASGVGLSNVRRRLERLYGPRAGIALANRPEGGLLVTVTLPYHE